MRLSSLLFCVSALVAVGGAAQAGDRYGVPGDAAPARAPDWNRPLLNWTNKSDEANVVTPVTAVKPAIPAEPVHPAALSNWPRRATGTPENSASWAMSSSPASTQPANLPASLYDAPMPHVAAVAPVQTAPDPYHPVRPKGEVVELALADLPPAGPSLERQQAAQDDAQVLGAQIARINAQAAQNRASGKAVPASTNELLGGPQ